MSNTVSPEAALNQELGPRQLALVEALESGNYQQTTGQLYRNEGDQKSYCCLGVACVMMGLEPVKPDPNDEGFMSRYGFGNERNTATLPSEALDYYQFHTEVGSDFHTHLAALSQLNDKGISFTEIAATLRSRPRAFFKEAV